MEPDCIMFLADLLELWWEGNQMDCWQLALQWIVGLTYIPLFNIQSHFFSSLEIMENSSFPSVPKPGIIRSCKIFYVKTTPFSDCVPVITWVYSMSESWSYSVCLVNRKCSQEIGLDIPTVAYYAPLTWKWYEDLLQFLLKLSTFWEP